MSETPMKTVFWSYSQLRIGNRDANLVRSYQPLQFVFPEKRLLEEYSKTEVKPQANKSETRNICKGYHSIQHSTESLQNMCKYRQLPLPEFEKKFFRGVHIVTCWVLAKKEIGKDCKKSVATQLAINKMLQILINDFFKERETITYSYDTRDIFPTKHQELDGFSKEDIGNQLTNNDNETVSSVVLLEEMCKYYNLPSPVYETKRKATSCIVLTKSVTCEKMYASKLFAANKMLVAFQMDLLDPIAIGSHLRTGFVYKDASRVLLSIIEQLNINFVNILNEICKLCHWPKPVYKNVQIGKPDRIVDCLMIIYQVKGQKSLAARRMIQYLLTNQIIDASQLYPILSQLLINQTYLNSNCARQRTDC